MMIVRTQLDLLGVLPSQAATAAKSTLGVSETRFDVAMLQATKSLHDASPEGQAPTLDPKVVAALEATLQQLAQQTPDQLKSLAKDKTALQGVVDNVAQAAGLGVEEKTVLGQLTGAALPRLEAYKAGMLSMGSTASIDGGGVKPGPQGGTPALAGSPADSIQAAPLFTARQQDQDQATGNASPSLSALAAQALTPVLISTRTDDGSHAAGMVSLASASNHGEGAPTGPASVVTVGPASQDAPATARVIPISTSGDAPAQAGVSLAPEVESAMQQGLSLSQAPVAQASVPDAFPGATTAPDPEAASPAQPSAPSAPAAREDVQARFTPLTEPLAVEEGSVVTLKGDAKPTAEPFQALPLSPASAAATVAPAGVASPPVQGGEAAVTPQSQQTALPSAPSAAEAPAHNPGAQAASLAQGDFGQAAVRAPQFTAPAPAAPAAAAGLAPQGIPAAPLTTAPAASVPASQPLPQAAPLAPLSFAAAMTAPALAAPVAAPRLTEPAPMAAPQPAGSPMAADTPAAGSVRSGVQSQAATVAPQFGLAATAGAKAQDAAGPVNGLGQQGQDAVKALAQQVAQDAAVKQGSFQQVTQALKDAPGAESGRLVISLKPAHLGDVTVDLVLSGGKINARLVASSPAVRDAFVQDLAGFKAGLEAHGVSVNEVSVALRAGVQDQQSQPQPQRQQDQAWWRGMADLKDPDLGRALGSAVYFGGESATDQRFSALA